MIINSDRNRVESGLNVSQGESNPFDLDMKTTQIPIHNGQTKWMSQWGCTPGCGMTGTGNSFCCTCK